MANRIDRISLQSRHRKTLNGPAEPVYYLRGLRLVPCSWKGSGWYGWLEPAWYDDSELSIRCLAGYSDKEAAIRAGQELANERGIVFSENIYTHTAFPLTPLEALALLHGGNNDQVPNEVR